MRRSALRPWPECLRINCGGGIFGNQGMRSDDRAVAHRDAFHDRRMRGDPYMVADGDRSRRISAARGVRVVDRVGIACPDYDVVGQHAIFAYIDPHAVLLCADMDIFGKGGARTDVYLDAVALDPDAAPFTYGYFVADPDRIAVAVDSDAGFDQIGTFADLDAVVAADELFEQPGTAAVGYRSTPAVLDFILHPFGSIVERANKIAGFYLFREEIDHG